MGACPCRRAASPPCRRCLPSSPPVPAGRPAGRRPLCRRCPATAAGHRHRRGHRRRGAARTGRRRRRACAARAGHRSRRRRAMTVPGVCRPCRSLSSAPHAISGSMRSNPRRLQSVDHVTLNSNASPDLTTTCPSRIAPAHLQFRSHAQRVIRAPPSRQSGILQVPGTLRQMSRSELSRSASLAPQHSRCASPWLREVVVEQVAPRRCAGNRSSWRPPDRSRRSAVSCSMFGGQRWWKFQAMCAISS